MVWKALIKDLDTDSWEASDLLLSQGEKSITGIPDLA